MMSFRKYSNNAIINVIIGTLILMIPAMINGFPFIFPDSGDYLVLKPLLHRSPYYGLLITIFHINRYIWAPILMQCAIVSHLIWVLIKLYVPNNETKDFIIVIILLTAFTSLPFFTGFIMADIFTPIMFLTMYIIVFHYDALPLSLIIYFFLLDCISIAAHISDLTLSFSLILLFLLLIFISYKRITLRFRRSLVLAIVPVLISGTAILTFNVVIFSSLSLSPAGQSFFMANLIQYGPAKHYLEYSCPTENYKICAYMNQLPDNADKLLWSSGIYQSLGGFEGMQREASIIVRKTIEAYPLEVLEMIGKNFLIGLETHEPAAEFYKQYQVPSFPFLIAKKFGPDTLNEYENSLEMRNKIPHAFIRTIDNIVSPLSFIFLIWMALISYKKDRPDSFIISTAVIMFICGNTLLCTTLSGIHDRYQARVTWLAPLVGFLFIIKSRANKYLSS